MATLIERISGIDGFERFELAARPVVIAGGAAGFRATRAWTASYLEAAIGAVEIRYKQSSRHSHPDFHAATLGEMFAVGKATFADFLRAVTTGPLDQRARRLFTGDE